MQSTSCDASTFARALLHTTVAAVVRRYSWCICGTSVTRVTCKPASVSKLAKHGACLKTLNPSLHPNTLGKLFALAPTNKSYHHHNHHHNHYTHLHAQSNTTLIVTAPTTCRPPPLLYNVAVDQELTINSVADVDKFPLLDSLHWEILRMFPAPPFFFKVSALLTVEYLPYARRDIIRCLRRRSV